MAVTKHKGRIVEINKYANSATFIKQGITKDQQCKYENRYAGGNGTYVTGGMYLGTHLDVKVFVYDDNKAYTFNVYEDVRNIKEIKNHVGDKVDVIQNSSGGYDFDVTQIL